MKKTASILATALLGLLCLSITMMPPLPPQSASADQIDGVYIFSYSKPDTKFEVLGTVKLPGLEWSERSDKCLQTLLKRAKKDHPRTDGLIVNTEFSKAECIKIER